jgi:murein DD-endopeptidase MepM/ murein hydrolase activator NlpD
MRRRAFFHAVVRAVLPALLACASAKPARLVYRLPYPVGTSCLLLQGNNGPWGHEGKAAYAYDFRMPIGSEVTAARGGVVVKTEGRFEDGTRKPGQENYVFIAHGDGSFGRYYHLTKDGALVKEGATVRAGDRIGKSGNSGASAGPHLHFDVTKDCPEWGCQTIPIAFANARENPLVADQTYEALPVRP